MFIILTPHEFQGYKIIAVSYYIDLSNATLITLQFFYTIFLHLYVTFKMTIELKFNKNSSHIQWWF